MIRGQDITALILAGGKGRRMGGKNKGLLPFGDGLLVEQVLVRILPQVGAVMISANRNQEIYARLGYPVVADPLEGFQGPLAGFLAGLENMRTDYLLSVPCDGPFIVDDLAVRLARGLTEADADIAVAHDGDRLQPVYALLHRRVLADLRSALELVKRSVWTSVLRPA